MDDVFDTRFPFRRVIEAEDVPVVVLDTERDGVSVCDMVRLRTCADGLMLVLRSGLRDFE